MRRITSLRIFLKVSISCSLLFEPIAGLALECVVIGDNSRAHVAVAVFLRVTFLGAISARRLCVTVNVVQSSPSRGHCAVRASR